MTILTRTALRIMGLALAVLIGSCSLSGSEQSGMTSHWIVLSDGVRLSADIYWPTGESRADRYPVLLEYLPYRKAESRGRNYALYSYFLERGYVVARVDIRGTGNSEGKTIPYEYSDIELDDGEEVIAWLAQQPWSSGKVGMFGISWGGFNSIQLATRNPPALKAFVAVMATEALYLEDVHYMDGIIHADSWMMSHDLYNAMPGAPDFKLDSDWLDNRFGMKPSIFEYMGQQRDGPFWDRASGHGKYKSIKAAGYHIGGWYDGYRNSLPRMLENVEAPVKAMIGPWDHYFPHNAWPMPQVEWRHEAVRWYDQFLKGVDTGILDEPDLAIYVRQWHAPDPALGEVPGEWRWEDGWPIARMDAQDWYARADHSLAPSSSDVATHKLSYKASVGLEGGGPTMWWGSVTPDQSPMDEDSLAYDSAPLDQPMEILGRPMARLKVSADARHANWVVRISDVSPDGRLTQVTGAAINGTHRNSAREPEYLQTGEVYNLEFPLHFTSWVFPKGHRVRVAISNAQWPMLWPTPYPMTTSLMIGEAGGSHIQLPVIPPGDHRRPNFKSPAPNPMLVGYETLEAGNVTGYAALNATDIDQITGEVVGVARNAGAARYPWGVEHFEDEIEFRTSEENPAVTSVRGRFQLTQELTGRTLVFEQKTTFSSDAANFDLTVLRTVSENNEPVAQRSWHETIPRDHQ